MNTKLGVKSQGEQEAVSIRENSLEVRKEL